MIFVLFFFCSCVDLCLVLSLLRSSELLHAEEMKRMKAEEEVREARREHDRKVQVTAMMESLIAASIDELSSEVLRKLNRKQRMLCTFMSNHINEACQQYAVKCYRACLQGVWVLLHSVYLFFFSFL